jgi:D-amino-acid oxidase
MEILVLGAGVSGLTTGLRLLEEGHSVRVWAKALPPATTSNVAAAVWYPYKAYPVDKVAVWGAVAYQAFERLARMAGSGVLLSEVLELLPSAMPDPWWVAAVSGFRRAEPEQLPPGYADGWLFAAPVIEMSRYLEYLLRTLRGRGGAIEERGVGSLGEALDACPIVVNCTGLGARELCGDHDLHPSRGQVARIRHNGFRRVVLDDYGPNSVAYIVPRVDDIVLGGTDIEGEESTTIDPATTRDILRRCARLDPAFAGVTEDDIVSEACGLRPVRSMVRLEAERVAPGRLVIHNYGHGGAGVTLSWGCAAEVAALVAR